MHCGVCGYSWCWTCGFESYNWFHTIQMKGFFCECVNGLAFGFGMEVHWVFRFILSILCITFMPLIGIVAFTCLIFADFGGEKMFFAFNDCLRGVTCCKFIILSPILITVYLSWYLFVLALFIGISVIVVALGIVPAYLLLFTVSVIIPIRFLCCPKRK